MLSKAHFILFLIIDPNIVKYSEIYKTIDIFGKYFFYVNKNLNLKHLMM